MFITIYTDASFKHQCGTSVLAWRGRCEDGTVSGTKDMKCTDVHQAEMAAIRYAVADAVGNYPHLKGVFINSDNINCVRAFWDFGSYKCPAPAADEFRQVKLLLGARWIRTKHVKAHTGKNDTRSYMNRSVDRMTR